MTPERLAEIEEMFKRYGMLPRGACDDLIARIRDLEAQVREAREALREVQITARMAQGRDAKIPPESEAYMLRDIMRHIESLATATPPSPEVAE